MKTCITCDNIKPLSEFHKNASRKDGHCQYCKNCRSIQRKDRSGYDPVKQRNNTLKSRYGISQKEFGQLFSSQNGLCKICSVNLENNNPCVDHCHITGKIRGILCKPCNTMLGYAKDDISVLSSAVKYLSNP